MAQRRSPAAQPQLPFFGPAGTAGVAAAGPVPPAFTTGAAPVVALPPPLGVAFPATATALDDVAGAALAIADAVGGGSTTGGATEATTGAVFSVAMGCGLSPPFIAKKAPTIASAATAMPTPMKIGALLAGGGAMLGADMIGAAIGAATCGAPSGNRPA